MQKTQNGDYKSTLILKNITILGNRTSVRLEPEMWAELKNIAAREKCTIHELCSLISLMNSKGAGKRSLTAALRVFVMLYYRSAATEQGHKIANHGNRGGLVDPLGNASKDNS